MRACAAESAECWTRRLSHCVGEGLPPDAQLPFTPRSARVARRVIGEGERLGHDAIGSEHVLRALLRAGDGVAVRILRDLGVDVSAMAKGLRKPRPDP